MGPCRSCQRGLPECRVWKWRAAPRCPGLALGGRGDLPPLVTPFLTLNGARRGPGGCPGGASWRLTATSSYPGHGYRRRLACCPFPSHSSYTEESVGESDSLRRGLLGNGPLGMSSKWAASEQGRVRAESHSIWGATEDQRGVTGHQLRAECPALRLCTLPHVT